jgi:hypothetical protein
MSLETKIKLLIDSIAAEFGLVRSEMGGGGGASVAVDDSIPTGDDTLWYQPSKGKFMIKVDGQWVVAAKDGIDGSNGSDGSDGADGTMPDGSVTYAKLSTALKSIASKSTGAWDFSAQGIIEAAISSNATVTLSNLKQNMTLKVQIVITNSATITFPAYCKKLKGFIDPSGTNGTYYAYFDCWNDGSGTEKVLLSITQEDA